MRPPRTTRSTSAALAAAAVVSLAGLPGLNSTSVAAPHAGAAEGGSGPAGKPDLDTRSGSTAAQVDATTLRGTRASVRAATERLRSSLGSQSVVEMSGTTGTVRVGARLDGFLTPRSGAPAAQVALDYVRRHAAALGLDAGDLETFRLRRDYVDVAGIHHLSFVQERGGVPVFGNGLQAAVTKDGRLLSLGGSPVSGLRAPVEARTTVPSPRAAIATARRDVGEPATAGPADSARRMLFVSAQGTVEGYRVVTMSASVPHLSFVAADGRVLFRQNLQDDAERPGGRPHSTGVAFPYFPQHRYGGDYRTVDFTKKGWLSGTADKLRGNNSRTYSDVNDDDRVQPNEQVPAKRGQRWNYRLKPFHLADVSFCDNPYPCSWDPDTAYSWRVNRKQNATQVFYFVNKFHDHLAKAPIGFTEAAGNFQRRNRSGEGLGRDALQTQTDDGANTTGDGFPDGDHVDNANMSTPPDGIAPRMQMYLQHLPGTTYPDGDPFAPTNVGDEADTVYHEYTHGLSNRLVVDATGTSTLGPVQGGAMGEGWSDWYAMDFLVDRGFQKDRPRKSDLVLFQYDGLGVYLDRTEPLDCKVGKPTKRCTGGLTGHRGGYTYADFGTVVGGPEVHGDGEIWGQTAWDLRDKLGSKLSESLLTRAMELSPANPSFLDMRNDVLLADAAIYGRAHQDRIWKVFAKRGMGFYAGSLGGDDTSPGADFHTPSTTPGTGTISGRVVDQDTGQPAAGVTVALAFQGSPGSSSPSDVTAADGTYALGPVPVGTYPKLVAFGGGYDPESAQITVDADGVRKNFSVRRDWASASGGATVRSSTGADYSEYGCGPGRLIDLSAASGWTTDADLGADGQVTQATAKQVTVALPAPIDIGEVTIDPTATCGLGLSASLGRYTVQASSDGTTYHPVAAGEFTAADRGRANSVALSGDLAGIRFIRLVAKAPMVLTDTATYPADACNPDQGYDGCSYLSVAELEVYGID